MKNQAQEIQTQKVHFVKKTNNAMSKISTVCSKLHWIASSFLLGNSHNEIKIILKVKRKKVRLNWKGREEKKGEERADIQPPSFSQDEGMYILDQAEILWC